jgi:predicted ArsR family transcriptional regulator
MNNSNTRRTRVTKEEYLKIVGAVRKAAFQDRVDDLNALKEVFGDQVVDIVLAERAKKMRKIWQDIALDHGKNDIEGLKETLWTWVQEAGFEFTFTETDEGTQFHVTKCPLAEMAHELQATDWGYICYCADDPHIVAGFNPAIGFRRTKTLMEGHECCDHFYYMKADHPEL